MDRQRDLLRLMRAAQKKNTSLAVALAARNDSDVAELNFKQELFKQQLASLAVVGMTALVWVLVNYFWPTFFTPFQWIHKSANVWVSILLFWPMFLYAGIMSVLSCFGFSKRIIQYTSPEEHLAYDTITSMMAGLWEELGFRCVFILTAMIGIVFANLAWSWLLLVFVALMILGMVSKLGESKAHGSVILAVLGLGGYLLYCTWGLSDPVYWIWLNVMMPFFHYVSFGALDPILYFPDAPWLFIAGAIVANGKFRDGHKYQGFYGFCNAWVIGFVLLYAMLYHGLWVAILIHAFYDAEIGFIRYFGRKAVG